MYRDIEEIFSELYTECINTNIAYKKQMYKKVKKKLKISKKLMSFFRYNLDTN